MKKKYQFHRLIKYCILLVFRTSSELLHVCCNCSICILFFVRLKICCRICNNWNSSWICYNCRIAYLHEGLEPKVVHRDIKSSNILLDKHWNPKVSDFGLAKHLGSGSSYVTTRVMGTFGYVYFFQMCLNKCPSLFFLLQRISSSFSNGLVHRYKALSKCTNRVNTQVCSSRVCMHRNAQWRQRYLQFWGTSNGNNIR